MQRLLSLMALCALALETTAQLSGDKLPVLHQVRETSSRSTFLYALETTMTPYENLTDPISINQGEIWDDPTYLIDIPFPFEVNGWNVQALEFVGLGGAFYGITSEPFVFQLIAVFEADLVDRGFIEGISQSPLGYQVEGDPGSRIFKIEWNNAGSFEEMDSLGTLEMFVNFQLWLHEGSQRIEIHIGPSNITQPDIFYTGDPGAFVGFAAIDEELALYWDDHFLDGPAEDPQLVNLDPGDVPFLIGTPSEGRVYRFLLNPVLQLSLSIEDAICNQPNGTATVTAGTGTAPFTYLWQNGDTTQSTTGLLPGPISVTVTDALGISSSASGTVGNIELITLEIGATNETEYQAEDGTAWVIPVGGNLPYTYLWSNGSQDSLITDLAPDVYSVTVSDAEGCVSVASVSVRGVPCIEAVDLLTTPISCYGSCDGTASVVITSGVGPFTFLWNTGDTTSTLEGLCPETYSVFVTDLTINCTVELSIFPDNPEYMDFTVDEVVHLTDSTMASISITPSGGTPPYSYQWYGPDSFQSTDEDIFGIPPGYYLLFIRDVHDCEVVLDSIRILDLTSTGVNEIPALQVGIFPNPATDHVSLDVHEEKFEVVLFQSSGTVIGKWSNSRTIDTGQLPGGVYFIQIRADRGVYSGRLSILK